MKENQQCVKRRVTLGGHLGWVGVVLLTLFVHSVGCGPSGDGEPDSIVILDGASRQEPRKEAVRDFDEAKSQREHIMRDLEPETSLQEKSFFDEEPDMEKEHEDASEGLEVDEVAPQETHRPDGGDSEEEPDHREESFQEVSVPETSGQENPPENDVDADSFVGRACRANGTQGSCQRVSNCTGNKRPFPGFCPGPRDIQCCVVKATSSKCDETKRPTPNQGLREAPGVGGCPAGMIKVSNFCIDQYEASLVEILPNGTERSWSPYFNPTQSKVKAVSIQGAVPQGYISGRQAKAACRLAGKRLCTDQEWLRACQGANKQTYPYGKTRKPGWCNDARSIHPAVEYFGSSASWVFSKIQHACINQLPQSVAKTGSYSKCQTNEKVYDMMGNLHEWTSNVSGVFRGGYYVDTVRNGPGCLYRTTAHTVGHWDYSTGFRCCADLPRP